MAQSRKGSIIEACVNILFGYWLNVLANILIFPLFGWDVNLSESMALGFLYTFISLGRSYGLRRLFNRLHG